MKHEASQAGSTLLWAIGALVLLSVAGAMIAKMTPSTLQGKLEQEAGARAYYNANSGLNYILGMQQAAQASGTTLANFVDSMGNGTSKTMNLSGTDSFSYQLQTLNSANSTYQITHLVGTVKNQGGAAAYAYQIHGGGKNKSGPKEYIVTSKDWSSTNGSYIINAGNSTLEISQPTYVGADIAAKKVVIAYGATIDGNIVSSTSVTLAQSATVSKSICAADGDVSVGYGAVVSGDVSANGDIDMVQNSYIGGNANSTEWITMHAYTTIVKTATSPNSISYPDDISWAHQSVGSYVRGTPTINCSEINAPYDNTIKSCGTQAIGGSSTSKTNPLSEGSYGKVTLNYGESLYLSSGTYKFCNISTGYNTSVYLDISSGQDLNILVKGDVDFGQATTFYIKTTSSGSYVQASSVTPHSAAKYIYLGSNSNVTFGYDLSWFGTIYAKTKITLGQSFELIGAIGTPGSTSIGYGINVAEYVLADYAEKNWSTTSK